MTNTSSPLDLERIAAELSSALISDTLDGLGLRAQCLASGIRPLQADSVVAGRAYPVTLRRVYDIPESPFAGLLAALDDVEPGDVFVTPTHRATDIAVWGGLLSTITRERGGVGAITDGLVRDTREIRRLGFPVFSAGSIPYDSRGRHEIVAHRVPCQIDGVRIEPGDLIVADADGVVVVPASIAETVVAGATEKRGGERDFRAAVLSGMGAAAAYERFGVL